MKRSTGRGEFMVKEARLRWSETEWLSVVANALPLIESGMHRVSAMLKAQRMVLDKARHRDEKALAQSFAPSVATFEKAVAAFKSLSAADRAALVKQPPAPRTAAAAPEADAPRKGLVKWTARERAIMAAAVQQLKQEEGHGGMKLHDLYIKAQRMVLPADRLRGEGGIKGASYSGLLKRDHDEGIAAAWQFPETKDPYRLHPLAAVAAPAPAPAPTPTEAATDELVKLGANPMNAAVILFGSTMMTALEDLLKARDAQQAEAMAQRLAESAAAQHERIGQVVQDLLQVQVGYIAAEVSKGLRAVLLEELGAPSAKPAPAPAPASVASAPPPGLRIDVLGTIDVEWRKRIKDATTGNDELRFYDFSEAGDFAPHRGRHLIVTQEGKLPRALQKKIETTGIKPVYVRAAGGHVLRAVQDLKGGAGSATLQ
jgi:hypothetical protein